MASHPAYKNSTLVSKAAMASRLIVTTSSYVSKTLTSSAETFTQKTKPAPKPMTFTPTTHARIRKVHTFSEGAAGLSAKTVGQVTKYAQNIGATLAKRNKEAKEKGPPGADYKPGLLNKSMIAFSTIADGIDQAGRTLLTSTSSAATTVVGHRFGAEAGEISKSIGGGFKNVGLVYIDASGVSRKAIVKSSLRGWWWDGSRAVVISLWEVEMAVLLRRLFLLPRLRMGVRMSIGKRRRRGRGAIRMRTRSCRLWGGRRLRLWDMVGRLRLLI